MSEILGVAEAVLYVDDLERASHFYQRVLGLPLTNSFNDARFLQTGEHSTLILFDLQALKQRESVIPAHGCRGPGHVALSIKAEEYDNWLERLAAHDVAIEHLQRWPQGSRSIYFRDPDGNSLELIEAQHYPHIWQRLIA